MAEKAGTAEEITRILKRLDGEVLPEATKRLGEVLAPMPKMDKSRAEAILAAAWSETHADFLAMLEEKSIDRLPFPLQVGFLAYTVSALNTALPADFPILYIINHVIGTAKYIASIYSRDALPLEFQQISGPAIPFGFSEDESGMTITRFDILRDPSYLTL